MCGLMLKDNTIRINGSKALLSVQQVHSELVTNLWNTSILQYFNTSIFAFLYATPITLL